MRALTLILPLALLTTPALAESPAPAATTPAAAAPAAATTAPTTSAPMMMMHGRNSNMSSMPGMMSGSSRMAGCPMMMDERVEGRIAFLHTELKITPAQETVWKSYADALRANAKAGTEQREAMQDQRDEMKDMNAPARMKAHIALMEQKLADMKLLQTATEQLYGALTDDQKKDADQLLGQSMGQSMSMRR